MPIELLLKAFREYSETQSEESGKEIERLLNQLVDYKIQHALDARRKESKVKKLNITGEINDSFKNMKSTVKSLYALNCAPAPMEQEDLYDKEILSKWIEAYEKWYNNERSEGMKIE